MRQPLDLRPCSLDQRFRQPTKRRSRPTNGICIGLADAPQGWAMAIAIIFLLGIANFTVHRAVLASGHAMVRALTHGAMARFGAVYLTLGLEFAVLLAAMLAASGDPAWAWAYAGYSAINLVAGWAILTGRI